MKASHQPVLLTEALNFLNISPNGTYVDCTFGRGGHAQQILAHLNSQGTLYGIDQDPSAQPFAVALTRKYANFKFLEGNFVNLTSLLALENVNAVTGILFDLGVSSPQFDTPERGFSYRFAGPLDMRMNPHQTLTAAQILNTASFEELNRIFAQYGQEVYHQRIAQAIIESRPLTTTTELVAVIKSALPAKVLRQPGHPAKKVFQALRIEVNQELNVLQTALEQGLKLLKPHGRMVVITFHSLEAKIVKTVFQKATLAEIDRLQSKLPITLPKTALCELVIKKPIHPTAAELSVNPRAHSAQLWVLEKRSEKGRD